MVETVGTKLRLATEEDVTELVVLVKSFALGPMPEEYRSFDRAKVEGLLRTSITDDNSVVLVLEVNGMVQGSLIGTLIQPAFSLKILATEVMWWINKEARGPFSAIRMLTEFERWSRLKGAEGVTLSHFPEVSDTSKMYKRLGFREIEITSVKDLR